MGWCCTLSVGQGRPLTRRHVSREVGGASGADIRGQSDRAEETASTKGMGLGRAWVSPKEQGGQRGRSSAGGSGTVWEERGRKGGRGHMTQTAFLLSKYSGGRRELDGDAERFTY